MSLPLSLVIITLNEESNLGRCIQSVPFAREVVVVDSGSTDRTRQIAEKGGARFIVHKFEGYRAQKQWALGQATEDWVLSLDADEALSPQLSEEIIRVLKAPSKNAYKMPRCSFHLGRWIRHGGWYPDYQTRLFNKRHVRWVGGAVHERIEADGGVGVLKGDLQHFVFRDLEDQIDTNNEFSGLGAIELSRRGQKFSLLRLIFRPLGKFFECYIWKRGFLDGAPGFIIALGAAQSLFLKYAKLWEAELKEPSQNI